MGEINSSKKLAIGHNQNKSVQPKHAKIEGLASNDLKGYITHLNSMYDTISQGRKLHNSLHEQIKFTQTKKNDRIL